MWFRKPQFLRLIGFENKSYFITDNGMHEEPQFPLRLFYVLWRVTKLTFKISKLRIWILYVGFGSYVRFWENQHRWIQILSTLQSHVTALVTYKSWIKGSSMTMYQKEKNPTYAATLNYAVFPAAKSELVLN